MEEAGKHRKELITSQCFQNDRKQRYENKALYALHRETKNLQDWHNNIVRHAKKQENENHIHMQK